MLGMWRAFSFAMLGTLISTASGAAACRGGLQECRDSMARSGLFRVPLGQRVRQGVYEAGAEPWWVAGAAVSGVATESFQVLGNDELPWLCRVGNCLIDWHMQFTFRMVGALVLAVIVGAHSMMMSSPLSQDSIFCLGRVLNVVQMSRIFPDSKHFVDLPLRQSPAATLAAFNKSFPLGSNPSNESVSKFVSEYFGALGSDIAPFMPVDWTLEPRLFGSISDPRALRFAQFLNQQWKALGRKQTEAVQSNPERFTAIPLPHEFIVAGGRFREMYYWDSYWIVKGLIAVDMNTTAVRMLSNMVHLIEIYGYIPNGARIYYRTRAQPPVAALIAQDLFNANLLQNHSSDSPSPQELSLADVVAALDHEYEFFRTNRSVQIGAFTLCRYFSDANVALNSNPRPESYVEDYTLAANLSIESQKQLLWRQLRAGAESGWDYSSRWLGQLNSSTSASNRSNGDTWELSSIDVHAVVPVCLNSILFRVEGALAQLHRALGNVAKAEEYQARQQTREAAMNALLFDHETHQWRDFSLRTGTFVSSRPYVSNFVPLWAGVPVPRPSADADVLSALQQQSESQSLLRPGGIVTSTTASGQQWDWPNCWPPLNWLVIEGLRARQIPWSSPSTKTRAQGMAKDLAQTWLRANYLSFNSSGAMYEKYDAEHPGETGGGGEYEAQTGFGWTNGVVLDLMRHYAIPIHL